MVIFFTYSGICKLGVLFKVNLHSQEPTFLEGILLVWINFAVFGVYFYKYREAKSDLQILTFLYKFPKFH